MPVASATAEPLRVPVTVDTLEVRVPRRLGALAQVEPRPLTTRDKIVGGIAIAALLGVIGFSIYGAVTAGSFKVRSRRLVDYGDGVFVEVD